MALAGAARLAVSPGGTLDAAGARRGEIGLKRNAAGRAAADAKLHDAGRRRRSHSRTDANRADFPFAGRSESAGPPARHRDTALAGRIKARRAGAVIGRFRYSAARAKQALRRAKLCHKISRGHRRRPTRGRQAKARRRARLRRGNLRAARAHGDAFRRRRHDLRPRLERRQDRRRAALRVEWRGGAGARERRGRRRRRGLAIRARQQAAPVAAIFRRARAARYLTRARSAARHAARRRSRRRGRPPAPEDHGEVFVGSRLRAEHRAGRAA